MKTDLEIYKYNAGHILRLWTEEICFSIANALTFSRAFLALALLFLWFQEDFFSNEKTRFLILILIYIAAAVSDYFDGYFARKRKLLSSLGQFFDPLFDKIFVLSVFIGYLFYVPLVIPAAFIYIICGREVLVTVMRVLSLLKNCPLVTERHAKIKTFTHMLAQSLIWGLLWVYAFVYESLSFRIFFEKSMSSDGSPVALPALEDMPPFFLQAYFQNIFESKQMISLLVNGPNSFVFLCMLISLLSAFLYIVKNTQVFLSRPQLFTEESK